MKYVDDINNLSDDSMLFLEQIDIHSGKFNDIFKYAEDDNIYISFTDIPYKAGINPSSRYNTPLGIYCYQLKASIRRYNVYPDSNNFPFANDRKYINVLKPKENISLASGLMYSSAYSNYNFDEDIEKLKKWGKSNDSHKIGKLINEHIESSIKNYSQSAKVNTPMGHIWYILYNISENSKDTKSAIVWNFLLNKVLGYSLVRDDGDGIIHNNEPVQSVFLHARAFDVIDIIRNRNSNEENEENTIRRFIKLIKNFIYSHKYDKLKKTINTLFNYYKTNDMPMKIFRYLFLSLNIDKFGYEEIKQLILAIGLNRFLSFRFNPNEFVTKINLNINKVILTYINEVDVKNLNTLINYYEIPLNLLMKKFGKNAISDFFIDRVYIQKSTASEILDKILPNKNGGNINSIVSSMGVNAFSKMLIDLTKKSYMNEYNLFTLIGMIDIIKKGQENRSPYKISSIFDVTNDEFKDYFVNQLKENTRDVLYRITLKIDTNEISILRKYANSFIEMLSKLKNKLTPYDLKNIFQTTKYLDRKFYDESLFVLKLKGVINIDNSNDMVFDWTKL